MPAGRAGGAEEGDEAEGRLRSERGRWRLSEGAREEEEREGGEGWRGWEGDMCVPFSGS